MPKAGLRVCALLCLVFATWHAQAHAVAPASAPNATHSHEMLDEGGKLVMAGHAMEAITKYIDPVIAGYEALREDKRQRYFSANNQMQMIIYAALPAAAGDPANVEVMDANWARAYLMKGFALTELHRIDEAQTALQAAIALSPLNSQFKSELAYTYQMQKECDRSIATYVEAASNAEMGSDESTKTADLTRAWRGQGFCLVEQGKWADAAAMYEKCLALDPKDSKAKNELQYVEQHKPN